MPKKQQIFDTNNISSRTGRVIMNVYGDTSNLITGEWQTVRIEEIAEKVSMGPFGSSIKVETFVTDGVPVISGQHLHGFKVNDKVGFNFITPTHAERLKNAIVQRGDIIFTHAGNIGQVAFIPENSSFNRYVISQRQFYMRCDKSKVIPEFIVAYFKTPEGQHKLLANRSQVGVPSIARPVTYLRTIEIPLPALPEQRAIAHILGTLDDKIELNRRMNETLEAMARAIFKSWFVDFDPVRAKAEGRDTGLPKEIAGLFPDGFEDSELGEIPRGWKVTSVGEVFELNPTERIQKGKATPYLDMASVPTHGSYPDQPILRPFTSGSKFRNGDTLLARITPCLENGKTALIQLLPEGEIAWGSTEFIVIRAREPFPNEFGYLLARDSAFRENAIQSMSGTSGRQRVQEDSLAAFKIVQPDRKILKYFGTQVHKWFQLIKLNSEQIFSLVQTRDNLLPKLFSGEIRIS